MRLRSKINKTQEPAKAGFRKGPARDKLSLIGFLFGLPFFLMGAFFCWMGGIQPLVKIVESGSWPEVNCVITNSEVESNHGGDDTTYRVNIQFRYTFGSKDYTGGQYDFSAGSSSGSKGKRRIVARYPVGLETACWVNPENPGEAVLSRAVPGLVYFAIPFSSIFILVGLGIMAASLGLLPDKWAAKVRSRHKPVSRENKGSTILKPKIGKKGKLFGMLFFAIFWNGIVGVFVFQLIRGILNGRPEWYPIFFMIPFVLVGLGLIWGVIYYALAMGNPTFTLSLSEGNPRLGEPVHLEWNASGFLGRLDSLHVILEAQEAATYRRGTRSVTDHRLFLSEEIFATDQPASHTGGKLEIRVPDDAMHSFDGGNNKIEWQFHIRGSIRKWPDVDEVFPFMVRPLKLR